MNNGQDHSNLCQTMQEAQDPECSCRGILFKNPQTVACLQHISSTQCLRNFIKGKEILLKQCPCDAKTEKSEETCPPSRFINQLLRVLTKSESVGQRSFGCESCDGEHEVVSCCFDCETCMCMQCFKAHNRLKVMKDHRLRMLPLPDPVDQRRIDEQSLDCQEYRREEAIMSCEACNSCVCQTCQSTDQHKAHVCVNINEANTTEQHRTSDLYELINDEINSMEKEQEQNERDYLAFNEELQIIRQHVDARTQDLIKEATKFKEELVSHLNTFQEQQYKRHMRNQCSVQQKLSQMKHILKQRESITKRKAVKDIDTDISRKLLETNTEISLAHSICCSTSIVNGERVEIPKFLSSANGGTDKLCINDTVADGETTSYKAIKAFGSGGEGKGEFKFPWAVAVSRSGEVAVTDHLLNRVQVFSGDGDWLRTFGSEGHGDGQLSGPVGVAFDVNENIIVCDNANHRIQVFDKLGAFVRQFGENDLIWPWGICVTTGGDIAVCDSNDIAVFSCDGELMRRFGKSDTSIDDEGPFYIAHAKNRYFVSYSDSICVRVFSDTGELLSRFGNKHEPHASIEGPRGLTIDMKGSLLVCDRKIHRIHMFSLEGSFEGEFGSKGQSLGEFHGPRDIAVATDGRVYVIGEGNSRVQVFAPCV